MNLNVTQYLLSASPGKASLVSALVHTVGIGLLGAVTWDLTNDFHRAPAGEVVLQLELVETEPERELQVALATDLVSEPQVVVHPDAARVDRRWYRREPTTIRPPRIDLPVEDRVALAENASSIEATEAVEASAPDTVLQNDNADLDPPQKPLSPPRSVIRRADAPRPRRTAAEARNAGYGDAPPDFTYQPSPVYPPRLQARRIEGTVLLSLDIRLDGTVTNVQVVRTSGFPEFDAAAVTTVRTWRCRPRIRAGQPVASSETLRIRFEF